MYLIRKVFFFFITSTLCPIASQVFCCSCVYTAVKENISFNRMIKCALQDIYLHNPNIKWNDIIGLDAAKQLVKEAVVYPIRVRMGGLLGGPISVHYSWGKLTYQEEKDRVIFCSQVDFFFFF